MKCVVEVIGKNKNKHVYCVPHGETLRGRLRASNQRGQTSPELGMTPDTPGIHISFDNKALVVRIFDPLEQTRYADVRESHRRLTGVGNARIETKIELKSDQSLAEWSNWIAHGIESGDLELREGDTPPFVDLTKKATNEAAAAKA